MYLCYSWRWFHFTVYPQFIPHLFPFYSKPLLCKLQIFYARTRQFSKIHILSLKKNFFTQEAMSVHNWLIDCLWFNAVSAIFQPYNDGECTQTVYIIIWRKSSTLYIIILRKKESFKVIDFMNTISSPLPPPPPRASPKISCDFRIVGLL